jgi:putative ABC transport system permease protein
MYTAFSFLALFIVCLGLFGLASFIVDQKNREIGICKVLGASVPGLLANLNQSFINGFCEPMSWHGQLPGFS